MVRLVALASLACVAPLSAQLIPVKTIPIAQGNQFQIFPAANLGMGSVSIALEDPVQDPFVNPASASRLRASRFFSSPTVYSVSRGAGGGRSLPVAILARRANWYGGLALALQQVEPSRPPRSDNDVIFAPADRHVGPTPPLPPSGGGFGPGPIGVNTREDLRAHGNRFAFGMIGRSIPSRNISIGASALWNGLHAVDGVDLLYDGSRRLAQSGHSLDLRVGALKEWPGERGTRALEALVVHNRFRTTHDVTFGDQFWDPNTQQFFEQLRRQRNFDHTSTWGLQLNYRMPVATPGWRIGWLVVANRSTHPMVADNELSTLPAVPRDPGRTTAYNLGIGVAKMRGLSRFGLDVIYEPMASYTWTAASDPVLTTAGDTIPIGGKTVENRFRFTNALFRIGVDEVLRFDGTGDAVGIQLGLIGHAIRYRLAQRDHVQQLQRNVRASWFEWTPTWGLSVRLPELELRYQGRSTKGAGRPQPNFFFGGPVAFAGTSIVGAPIGQFQMTDVSTVTHQISISVPLR